MKYTDERQKLVMENPYYFEGVSAIKIRGMSIRGTIQRI